MAKAANNLLLRGVSGKLGGMVVRQMRDGSIRLCAAPDFSNRELSDAQKDHHKRFKQAAAYARQAAKLQPVYAEQAGNTVKTAYNIALSDWFNPPVIHCVERVGGTIRVEASDNVKVARVQVTISDQEGGIVERGEAIRGQGDWWEYVSSTEGRVAAGAWDLAGNCTESALHGGDHES